VTKASGDPFKLLKFGLYGLVTASIANELRESQDRGQTVQNYASVAGNAAIHAVAMQGISNILK
jgi:hypothetical protein